MNFKLLIILATLLTSNFCLTSNFYLISCLDIDLQKASHNYNDSQCDIDHMHLYNHNFKIKNIVTQINSTTIEEPTIIFYQDGFSKLIYPNGKIVYRDMADETIGWILSHTAYLEDEIAKSDIQIKHMLATDIQKIARGYLGRKKAQEIKAAQEK